MKKCLIAAALIVGFATPALADAVYVMLNPTNHKCITTRSPGCGQGLSVVGPRVANLANCRVNRIFGSVLNCP